MKKTILNNEKGFALLAAIIASMILLAVAMLVMNMSAGDLISSSMTVGNKKAFAAAESGINYLVQNFSPDSTTWTANYYTTNCSATNPYYNWPTIPGGTDNNTEFVICSPLVSSMATLPAPGYAINQ